MSYNFYTPKSGPLDVVVTVVDVNSELNAEEELRELRERVQRIVDSALDGQVRIVVRTRDSTFTVR